MSKKRVVIVGCGSVGSRHLQAVAKLHNEIPLSIQVVERSDAAIRVAETRLKELHLGDNLPAIEWLKNISMLDTKVDLTIVATASVGRVELIKQLLVSGHRQFLVEKIVCQSANEYVELIQAMNLSVARGWVNCPFRYFDFYTRMLNSIDSSGNIALHVSAGSMGLGCIAIHYLDLFLYLARGDANDLQLGHAELRGGLQPNKRSDKLVEFSGTISGSVGEHSVSITSLLGSKSSSVLQLSGPNIRFCADEQSDIAFVSREDKRWKWESFPYRYQHTSETTALIVRDLFTEGTCRLPTLADCKKIHEGLFKIFNSYIEAETGKYASLCPIT